MAEKKSKKKEKKIMNLNQFHETVSTSKEIDWANELEENMPVRPLPDAPRSLMQPEVDEESIPMQGPFLLALDNAPFEVTEMQIEVFFSPIPLKAIVVQSEFGRKKMPQVEFETREHLIRALKEKYSKEIGFRTIKLKKPEEFNQPAGGKGGYNNRRGDQDGGGFGMGVASENAGNWRDNAPAFQGAPSGSGPQQSFGSGGGGGPVSFDRSQMAPFAQPGSQGLSDARRSQPIPGAGLGREANFQIERNMQNVYTESRPPIGTQDSRGMAMRGGNRHEDPRTHQQPPPPLADRPITRSNFIPSSSTTPSQPPEYQGHFSRQPHEQTTSYGPVPPGLLGHQDSRGDRRSAPSRRFDEHVDVPFVRRTTNVEAPSPLQSHHAAPQEGHFRDARHGREDVVLVRNTAVIPPPAPRPQVASQQQPVAPPPVPRVEPPRERPRIILQPRTSDAVSAHPAEQASNAAIFGGARPVDKTAQREQEIEEKLRKEKEAAALDAQKRQEAAVAAKAAAHDQSTPTTGGERNVAALGNKLGHVNLGAPSGPSRNADGRPVASVHPYRVQGAAQPQQSGGSELSRQQSSGAPTGGRFSVLERDRRNSENSNSSYTHSEGRHSKLHSQVSSSSQRSGDHGSGGSKHHSAEEGDEGGAASDTSSQTGFQTVTHAKNRRPGADRGASNAAATAGLAHTRTWTRSGGSRSGPGSDLSRGGGSRGGGGGGRSSGYGASGPGSGRGGSGFGESNRGRGGNDWARADQEGGDVRRSNGSNNNNGGPSRRGVPT